METHPCEFSGIWCKWDWEIARVVGIVLESNWGVNAPFLDFSGIDAIEQLIFRDGNTIQGTIPYKLSQLARLRELEVHGDELNVPWSVYNRWSNLCNLRRLELHNVNMEGNQALCRNFPLL